MPEVPQMPTCVAGYYMTFPTTRALMDQLEINDRGVDNKRLEFPINNWLAGRGILHVLAGAIGHPVTGQFDKEDGILIMTKFLQIPRGSNPVVQEQERDISVKDWLVEEGGVKPDELEWMSLFDHFCLTRNGIQPKLNDVSGPSPPVIFNILMARWENSRKSLDDFVADEVAAGRFKSH